MVNRLGIGACLVGVVVFSVPLVAHHGAASFDTGKMVTVNGTVTEYVWSNPHVLVKVDAKDDSGNVAHWVLEAWNPVTQASRGWSKNTFKPGDDVSLDIAPAKNNAAGRRDQRPHRDQRQRVQGVAVRNCQGGFAEGLRVRRSPRRFRRCPSAWSFRSWP